jgi:hypothetical protein
VGYFDKDDLDLRNIDVPDEIVTPGFDVYRVVASAFALRAVALALQFCS